MISIRSISASDSLERLAVPARWPLISTSTWLLKSRPWPSVAAPRMLIEVWPGVHSLMKPTAFCASSSVTDFAVERSISEFSMICTGPTTFAPARPPGARGHRGRIRGDEVASDDLDRAGHPFARLGPPAGSDDDFTQ